MEQRAKLELTGSRLFTAWLAQARASLAFATYQAGKLFLIRGPDRGPARLAISQCEAWLAERHDLIVPAKREPKGKDLICGARLSCRVANERMALTRPNGRFHVPSPCLCCPARLTALSGHCGAGVHR